MIAPATVTELKWRDADVEYATSKLLGDLTVQFTGSGRYSRSTASQRSAHHTEGCRSLRLQQSGRRQSCFLRTSQIAIGALMCGCDS
jgi:hypothetical protein